MHSFFSLEHSEETWNFKNALKLPSLVSQPPTLPPGQLPLSSRGSLSVYRVYQLEKSLDKRQAKSNPSELNGTEDHGSTWVQCDQRWSFHSFDGIMEWKLLSSTLHLKEPLGSSMTPSSAWHFRKTTTNPNRDVFFGHPASEWALATKAPSTPKAPISFSITAIWRVRVSHVVPMIPRLQNSLRPLKATLWYQFLSIFRQVHPGSIPKYVGWEAPWPLLRCTTISTVLGHPDPTLAFFQCSVESCLWQAKCQEEKSNSN